MGTFDVAVRGFRPGSGFPPEAVDELVAKADGGCVFHLETLDDDLVWLAVYLPGTSRRVSAAVSAEGGKLVVRVQDDDRTPAEKGGDENPPPGGDWSAWHPWGREGGVP